MAGKQMETAEKSVDGTEHERYSNLVDEVTVDVASLTVTRRNNSPLQQQTASGTLRTASSNKAKRDQQIEAVIEIIERTYRLKIKLKECEGVVLNDEMCSEEINLEKSKAVLGSGCSAGDVILVRDKNRGKDMAYKNIMIAQFNANEIRAWVNLADDDAAPELYCFRLNKDKVEFFMEPLKGQTLQRVIDEGKLFTAEDPRLAKHFSLCILDDLLGKFEKLREKNFIHGDVHGGNVMLETSMAVKLIDFGSARSLLSLESKDKAAEQMKLDIVGIIRIFCALYSGVDFDNTFDAKKQLQADDFSKLSEYMGHIDESSRRELYNVMSMLFDTVRRPEQEGFGDTSHVKDYVGTLLPEDVTTCKKKAAVILFPEQFQVMRDSGISSSRVVTQDGTDSRSRLVTRDGTDSRRNSDNPIWDYELMNVYVKNVTEQDLAELDKDKIL